MVWRFACLSLLLCLACTGTASREQSAPDEQGYTETCYRLAAALKLYGFDRDREECRLEIDRRDFDPIRRSNVIIVTSPALKDRTLPGLAAPFTGLLFEFDIDAQTREVVGVTNFYLAEVVLSSAREEQDRERQRPTLTEQDVRDLALKYVSTISGETDNIVYSAARYDPRVASMGRVWRVTFFRTTDGYRFDDDYVNIGLDENRSLRYFYKCFYSRPGRAVVNVTRKDAKATARQQLDQILKEAGVDPADTLLSIRLYSEETLFANPGRYPLKSDAAAEMEREEAMLVHYFVYTITAYDDAVTLREVWKATAVVCVDADSGEYICADTNL